MSLKKYDNILLNAPTMSQYGTKVECLQAAASYFGNHLMKVCDQRDDLIAVLKFYADEYSYAGTHGMFGADSDIEKDNGRHARTVLASLEAKKPV